MIDRGGWPLCDISPTQMWWVLNRWASAEMPMVSRISVFLHLEMVRKGIVISIAVSHLRYTSFIQNIFSGSKGGRSELIWPYWLGHGMVFAQNIHFIAMLTSLVQIEMEEKRFIEYLVIQRHKYVCSMLNTLSNIRLVHSDWKCLQ